MQVIFKSGVLIARISVATFVPEPSSLAMGATAVLTGLGYWWCSRRQRAMA